MTSIKKQLERVQSTDTQIKVVMPEKVLNQIKFLCKDIAKVEWSGILFYSFTGSIENPKEMVINLENILPMHKGTQSYTEYSFDERVIDYMEENDLDDCKMGHIHSHNTMGVFFSGTDWSELEDNAPNHNFYLSLIVNNFMDFCAKVCFIADTSETKDFPFYAKNENGQKYVFSTESYKVDDKKLIVFDCDIDSPASAITVDEGFSKRVAGIIKDAEERAKIVPKFTGFTGGSQTTPSGSGASVGKSWSRTGSFDKGDFPGAAWEDGADWFADTEFDTPTTKEKERKVSKNFKTGGPGNAFVKDMFRSDVSYNRVIEDFALYVVNTGNSTEDYGDMDDLVEMYMLARVNPKALVGTIIENYSKIYDAFFEDLTHTDREDLKIFIDITSDLIDEIECQKELNLLPHQGEFLNPIILALEELLTQTKAFA